MSLFSRSFQLVQLILNNEFADQTKTENRKEQAYDTVVRYGTVGFTLEFGNVGRKFVEPVEDVGDTDQGEQQFQTGIDIIVIGKPFEFITGKVHPEEVINAAGDE
jgi:hypothetical protein